MFRVGLEPTDFVLNVELVGYKLKLFCALYLLKLLFYNS